MELSTAQFAVLAGTIPALVIALAVERAWLPISGYRRLDRINHRGFPLIIFSNGFGFFVCLAGMGSASVDNTDPLGLAAVSIVAIDFVFLTILVSVAMGRSKQDQSHERHRGVDPKK